MKETPTKTLLKKLNINNACCYFITFLGLCLAGCNKEDCYEKGYESAWDGEEMSSSWANKDEKEGYEQGLDDAWFYDEGYYDGMNKIKPKYFNDPFYMDGFNDGKKHRQ